MTSFLDAKGIPEVVQRTLIRPPSSQLGPIDQPTRYALMAASDMAGKYDQTLDRDSAFEMLRKRDDAVAKEAEDAEAKEAALEEQEREFKQARRYDGGETTSRNKSTPSRSRTADTGFGGALAAVVIKQLKGTTGRRIVRGILGGLFKVR